VSKKDKKDKKARDEKQKKKDKQKGEETGRAAEKTVAAGKGDAAASDSAAGPQKLTGKQYAEQLDKFHVELVKLQEWVKHKGLKVCIVFEGRDGAGKGGTIKAITERVSPRVFRVVALPAPTDREKSQMYLQRYVRHLPAAGEIVIFDRSWYNRAGVERVMGFTPEETVKKFLGGVPLIEKAIVDSGIILLKYWLEVSPDEQTRRLTDRIDDGRKIWKLSPMDLKSYSRWYDYSRARDEMFAATDTGYAPWYVVKSDDKRRARLNLTSHVLEQIPYEETPREKVELPKRQKPGDYKETNYPFKYIKERF
jgi:polyphosphate kinase